MSRKICTKMTPSETAKVKKPSLIRRMIARLNACKDSKDSNKKGVQPCGKSKSDEVYEVKLKPQHEVKKVSGQKDTVLSLSIVRWNNLHDRHPKTPKPASKVRFHDKVKVKNLYDSKEDRKSDWRENARRYRKKMKKEAKILEYSCDHYPF